MHPTMTIRRAALAAIGVAVLAVLVVLLTMALAEPAQAAPRVGITAARGVPAEATSATPAGAAFLTEPLSFAAITSPPTTTEDYFVLPWGAAWVIGALGAILLIGGARAFALAQRRERGGRLAELTGRRPEAMAGRSGADDERRKAA
jgi:hypothetical protein